MNAFYHSIDWGFDTSLIQKKEKAQQFLNCIGLPCCIKRVCNSTEVESFLLEKEDSLYLVMVLDQVSMKYTGFFDIKSYEQLRTQILSKSQEGFCFDRLKFCFISQMQDFSGCFTANIIADGKGSALIEFIEGTVDNRYLTSGGNYRIMPKRIIFNDFKMVYCDETSILLKLWDSLKTCLFYRGYYECSYAIINKTKEVYFSYYSDNEVYQNICLDYYEKDTTKYRCMFLSLLENGILN